jgi:GT2 family glycosyltransferase
MDIRVSIVLPFYANIKSLEKCLCALSAQEFQNPLGFEVLVVDNSPFGHDAPIVPSLARTLPLKVFHEARPGSYAARNRALREALGDFLLFTDADCVPTATWIEECVAQLERYVDSEGVYLAGRVKFIKPAHPFSLAARYDQFFHLKQKYFADVLGFAATANMAIRKTHFDRVGLFDEAFLSGGDQDWGRRAARAGLTARFAPRVVVRHPCVGSLRDLVQKERRMAAGRLRLARKWPAFKALPNKGLRTRYPRPRMILASSKPLAMLLFQMLHWSLRAVRFFETIRCRLGAQGPRV